MRREPDAYQPDTAPTTAAAAAVSGDSDNTRAGSKRRSRGVPSGIPHPHPPSPLPSHVRVHPPRSVPGAVAEAAVRRAAARAARIDSEFGAFEQHTTGIGSRILRNMGWRQGEGVGAGSRQGRAEPLRLPSQSDRKGIGFTARAGRDSQYAPQSDSDDSDSVPPLLQLGGRRRYAVSSAYDHPLTNPLTPSSRRGWHGSGSKGVCAGETIRDQ